MSLPTYEHVDEWLDAPTTDERELPAKMWLEKFRAPAHKQDTAWLASHVLTCYYKSIRHRVVGCSRMGDVWLTRQVDKPNGYEERVSINDCTGWVMTMASVAVDVEGPWRVTSCHEITGNYIPTIVDCCNRPLWSAHTYPFVLERIVADHNASLKPFVSEWETLDDDEPEEPILSDAYLVDDPVTDHRICNKEGWALFNVDSTGLLEIERDDEAGKFADDASAVAFVQRMALRGSLYHQKAIQAHVRDAAGLGVHRRGCSGVLAGLERMEQLAADTKKAFSFDKALGSWAWFDRRDEDNMNAWHTGFPTRQAALIDAIGPYLHANER